MRNCAVLLVLVLSVAVKCDCQTREYLSAFFKQKIGLTDSEIASIEQGQAVAKMLASVGP